jgi:hypothetical protein
MVPPEQLARVAGLDQTLQGGMIIFAPPIGALLLGVLPMPGVSDSRRGDRAPGSRHADHHRHP